MKNSVLIIPAAGSGSRLRSEAPKIFTHLKGGKTIFDLIMDQAKMHFDEVVLILSPDGVSYLKNNFSQIPQNLTYLIQHTPTGMFDAIDIALSEIFLKSMTEKVFIQWGDQPFIDKELYLKLSDDLDQSDASIPLIWVKDPYVQFKFSNNKVSILESRENDRCDKAGFKDMGLFTFQKDKLNHIWDEYKMNDQTGNVTNEKSFLKIIPKFLNKYSVYWRLDQPSFKGLGINTPDELTETISLIEQLQNM